MSKAGHTVHEYEEYEERGKVERRAKMCSKMQLFHRIIIEFWIYSVYGKFYLKLVRGASLSA
jgi:hypothetical protein